VSTVAEWRTKLCKIGPPCPPYEFHRVLCGVFVVYFHVKRYSGCEAVI